jgi:WhiB family transcriptional regulator, redox-sensing transcriptional regulator
VTLGGAVAGGRPAGLTDPGDLGWQDDAACAGTDSETWVPSGREPEVVSPTLARVCAACPVAEPCLRYAVEHRLSGIWSGTTRSVRERIRSAGAA